MGIVPNALIAKRASRDTAKAFLGVLKLADKLRAAPSDIQAA